MKPSKKIYAKGLGGPYLHIKRSLTNDKKTSLQKILEESLDQEIKKTFQNQVIIQIEISAGSIKVKVVIGAMAIFHFVCNYGSFRSGIDHLVHDVRNLSSSVIVHVVEEENVEPNEIIHKARRLGIPGKIQRYFKALDRLDDTDVNSYQHAVLINDLKNEFTDILFILENEHDRSLLIDETPSIIKEEIVNHIPTPIPGQLDLGYKLNQYFPSSYDIHVSEDVNQANGHQTSLSLSESYFYRPELPPQCDEDEE